MFRYVALMWNAESAQLSDAASEVERSLAVSGKKPGWSLVFDCPGVRVWASDLSAGFGAELFCGRTGVVLGQTFARQKDVNSTAPTYDAKFNRFETREALKSRGRSLAKEVWGNFVAFIVDEGGLGGAPGARYVFKDPCGTLPCYFTGLGGVQLVFSCLEDCQRLGFSVAVNWDFVRARAVHGFLDMEIPTLTGVSTVHRSECASFDRQGNCVGRSLYWHPSSFKDSEKLITDSASAAQALRATFRSCVHSLASHHQSVLAQVSGGLDSSIVLGCLGEAPNKPQITCYTIFTKDSVSDERRWARYAVARGGFRHMELCRDASAIEFRNFSALAPTVEPGCYFTAWQRGPLERELAVQAGATATFTGEAGDSTLCATTYSFAADHCLRRHGLGLPTLRTALRVAARRDVTVWRVMAKAVGRELFRSGGADERRRRASFNRLVSARVKREVQAGGGVAGGEANIWSRGGRITEETRQRLGALAFPPEFYDLSTSGQDFTPYSIAPMCAQPVVELCMRIPVDIHFDGGRIRGLARRAFADVVPAPILRRQWKDHPVLYFEEVIQNNLPFLREHLLDGALVREGILDREAVELALKSGPTRSAAVSGEIFSHLDLELWVRDCA
jgi:asparagine synthase (glutamine-hydrolysing)